jgi:hypothetical protein
MRKAVGLATVVIVLIVVWFAHSELRESRYRATLAHYQSDLPVGTPRAEVEEYLHSHEVQYMRDVVWVARRPYRSHAIAVPLGSTTGMFGCTSTAYLALEFEPSSSATRADATPVDRLKEIWISKVGRDCM